jgi:hypothetical protein
MFSGDVSDLFLFIFSDQWADHMYDEYPQYFWEDVLKELEGQGIMEIEVDMVYDHGEATEQDVREYMLKHKNEGPRFLIMPRQENVTMGCAWLRGYVVREVSAL